MIDLTPLDVRKKKGDFRKGIRGYEPSVVDDFLDLVAERLEELVRENAALKERAAQLSDSVAAFREREQAMNEALVSAQQLREEVRAQAQREAELTVREASTEAQHILSEAKRQALAAADATRRVHGQRAQFVRAFRAFVERQLGEIELEEERLRELPGREAEGSGAGASAGGAPPPPVPAPEARDEPGAAEPDDDEHAA